MRGASRTKVVSRVANNSRVGRTSPASKVASSRAGRTSLVSKVVSSRAGRTSLVSKVVSNANSKIKARQTPGLSLCVAFT